MKKIISYLILVVLVLGIYVKVDAKTLKDLKNELASCLFSLASFNASSKTSPIVEYSLLQYHIII